MSRPDPIQYAERLYAAIRDANFSPISFLAFGNAVKEGVALRSMPRMAAEPFMRVVGEMLDLEEEAAQEDIIDAEALAPQGAAIADENGAAASGSPALPSRAEGEAPPAEVPPQMATSTSERRKSTIRR
jgi:hypothetical protein